MEPLGFDIEWNSEIESGNLIKPEFDISLTIGNRTMVVNGNNVLLDVSAQLACKRSHNGTTSCY